MGRNLLEDEAAPALSFEQILNECPDLSNLRSNDLLVLELYAPIVVDDLLALECLVDTQIRKAVLLGSLVGIKILPHGSIRLVLRNEVPLQYYLLLFHVLLIAHFVEVLARLLLVVDHLFYLNFDSLLVLCRTPCRRL